MIHVAMSLFIQSSIHPSIHPSICPSIPNQSIYLSIKHGPRRTPGPTPGKQKHDWAKDILWLQQRRMEPIATSLGLPPWSDSPRSALTHPPDSRPPAQSLWQAYQLAEQWCWDRWCELEGGPPVPRRTTNPDLGGGWKPEKMPYKKATLHLHADLPKSQSSLLTQIHTGKIGLASFLHTCQVPSFESPACPCGWHQETARHIVLDCPRFHSEQRQLRQAVATTDFQQLTSNPRATATLTAWFLRLDLLPQFAWAWEQLPPT